VLRKYQNVLSYLISYFPVFQKTKLFQMSYKTPLELPYLLFAKFMIS